MKRITIFVLFSLLTFAVFAQTKLNESQQKQVIDKIDKAATGMTSMQCDFTQTKSMKMLKKEMLSKGMMYYKDGNKLRWEYTSPYDYTFIMNGDKIKMKSAKSTKNINMQGNKMFKQITDVILNCITGGSLKNSKDFKLELYKTDGNVYAKLLPQKKEMKQIYDYIELHFDASLTMVNTVKMHEKTGDMTTVKLTNIKTNSAIDEKTFAID